MNVNKAIIAGRVTKQPELKALPSGSKVVSFSLATNRTWKDKAGAKQEAVDFHDIVAFGKTAEIIAQYVVKGQVLYTEGRISKRSWDGKDGKKNYRTEIILETFQFGERPRGVDAPSKPADDDLSAYDAPGSASNPAVEEEINPDDIPF